MGKIILKRKNFEPREKTIKNTKKHCFKQSSEKTFFPNSSCTSTTDVIWPNQMQSTTHF